MGGIYMHRRSPMPVPQLVQTTCTHSAIIHGQCIYCGMELAEMELEKIPEH